MSASLTKQEQFLLEEYKSASELTNHIDELRNKLTGFYITFAGVAIAGAAILIKGEAKTGIFDKVEGVIAALVMLVAFTGYVVVLGLARLRRVQIEYFKIINGIREYFLELDYELWNRVQVCKKTLPTPSRRSGSYMWLLLVMLTSSSLFFFSSYLITVKVYAFLSPPYGGLASVLGFAICFFVEDRSYFAWARSGAERRYSTANPPF